MSIFKKSKISTRYNFMLICIDDFSNHIMVRLLRNKNAKSIHNAIIDIIKAEKTIPTIIYTATKGVNLKTNYSTTRKETVLEYSSP